MVGDWNDIGAGPRPRNRHSRVSGNPEMPAGSMLVFGRTVLDSRLRGNDGCGGRKPLNPFILNSVEG